MPTNYGAWSAFGEGLGKMGGSLANAYTDAYQKQKAQNRADEMMNLKQELGRGQLDLAQQRLDMSQQLAEAKQAAKVNPLTGGAKPTEVMGIKKDFDDVAKAYIGSRDGWNKVQEAATNPSPVGDISLIFGYMKTIDPTSTVREGEFATAQNSGGVPERVTNMYNRVRNGERLTKEQRADFMKQAYGSYKTYEESYKTAKDQSAKLAKAFGIDPSLVVTDYEKTARPYKIGGSDVNDKIAKLSQVQPNDPRYAKAQQTISELKQQLGGQ